MEDDTVVVRTKESGLWRCSDTASVVRVSLTPSVPLIDMLVDSGRSVKRLTRSAHLVPHPSQTLIRRGAGHQLEKDCYKGYNDLLMFIGHKLYAVLLKSTRKFNNLR